MDTAVAITLEQIKQVDRHHFTIAWSDGKTHTFRLSTVQKHCPCAHCRDGNNVDEDVSAKMVRSVGRYALRIDFTSGCSNGIYSFDLLYKLGDEHA